MANWQFDVGDPAATLAPKRQLASATGRRLTARLDAAWDAQFSYTGPVGPWVTDHETRDIVPLATDLHARRDGDLIFRGRIGPENDTIDAEKHIVQFTAQDYRAMLRRRIIGPAGRAFTSATAQETIAITLIDESEALSGGAWGIDLGTNSGTTANRTLKLDPGAIIGDAIASLGRLDGGFEWEIQPDSTGDLKLNVWHDPGRGQLVGDPLEYGGLVTKVQRTLRPDDFANSVLVLGKDGLTPADEVTAGVGTDPRGRWERSFGFTTIELQASLDSRAVWVLDQSSVLRPEVTVELTAGYWKGRSHIWLGDTVNLVVRSGRLDIAAADRVAEVSIVIGDSGEETVTLGLLSVA